MNIPYRHHHHHHHYITFPCARAALLLLFIARNKYNFGQGGICMIVCPCLLFDFLWSVWCNPNSPHTVLFACGINEHGDPYSRHRLGGRDRENEHVPFLWSKKLNHVSICLRSHDCQRACAEVELQLRVDTRVAQLISPSYFRIRPAHCPTSLHCALLFILTGPLSPCKTRAVVERERELQWESDLQW